MRLKREKLIIVLYKHDIVHFDAFENVIALARVQSIAAVFDVY